MPELRRFPLSSPFRLLVSALLVIVAARATAADRRFLSGYAGTIPARPEDRAGTYFAMPEVRALLSRLESGSVPLGDASAALQGKASVDDLLRVGLLRRDGQRVTIGFAYFTAADMEKIHAAADRAAIELAKAYRDRKPELDWLLDRYSASGVSKGEL
ncbi:MAG TPA: hypothetical protein VG777_05675, partial [Thermoanaerobaculia bacterium]|nr:hypothetical protein [Thermoanaerobaculia bacterium]